MSPLSRTGVSQAETKMSRMPEGAWDSHIHIIDPARYPLSSDATYNTTGTYTVWENAIFENSIGASANTIIQPSIYGYDNSATLQALQAYGPDRARAVVVFDPAKTQLATLRQWHSLGVRGVRVNLHFAETPSAGDFAKALQAYADAIRPLDWVLQMLIPMHMIRELESFFPTLGVRIVFDHLGHPDVPDGGTLNTTVDPYKLDGFESLINLLKAGRTWLKISAPYRLSKSGGTECSDLDPLIKGFFKTAPDRLVYASDWPHTLFEGLDIRPWTEHLLDLVGDDETLRDKLFRDNAKSLWA